MRDGAVDLAIVGAGILGLAHALVAARRGLRVVVLERDAQANGASVRNFGLVVVTGQAPGTDRVRALRGRDIWLEVAAAAGIPIMHPGALLAVRRPEALALLEAFVRSGQAEGCRLLSRAELRAVQPDLAGETLCGGLHSPHELRVESREAIPRLTASQPGAAPSTTRQPGTVPHAWPPRPRAERPPDNSRRRPGGGMNEPQGILPPRLRTPRPRIAHGLRHGLSRRRLPAASSPWRHRAPADAGQCVRRAGP